MENNGIWEYQFKVRSFDVDQNKRLKITSLSEYLQEVAGDHANSKGFGYKQVIGKSMVWIISGIRIEINRLPAWEEEVTIKTWVVENNRFISRRDFQWLDNKGNVILNASTNWILYSTEKRRPQLVDSMNFDVFMHPGKYATSKSIQNIKANFDDSEMTEYVVRNSDLDMVGHMNNTKYIQTFLDSYPIHFIKQNRITSLDINFKVEALHGETLESRRFETPENEVFHELKRIADNKVNCLAKFQWKTN